MVEKYYLDTCIWRDHYENRINKNGKPIGDYASSLFKRIMLKKDKIIFSRLVYNELLLAFSKREVDNMLNLIFLAGVFENTSISNDQINESIIISSQRNLPKGDVLHAILARDTGAVLISRDKHFNKLKDLCIVKMP